jgi:hypothetical protein
MACGGVLQAQVTTRTDTVGKLLNQWFAEGAAAGLSAITYENRDAGHSALDTKEWPQLQVQAPEGNDKGPANRVRPTPLLGNCSMAMTSGDAGSLPRLYMLQQQGHAFMAAQFTNNNHFIYPEHHDYDAGWNGRGGWGDLYPANVPYVTICQGSSHMDQAFLRAYLSATAALPPATQKLILEKKLLAPTLQALLRRTYKAGKTEGDYFTGKVHPPVFDRDLIDEENMARLAHEMTPERIPPVVVIQTLREPTAEPGRHFFEPETIKDAKLGDSLCSIARIFRSSEYIHEMHVSARGSMDVQGRALKFKWVLLQGDLTRIRIETDKSGAEAFVAVAWHPEMRSAGGMQSHRVDIGVFAHNGAAWSAPAIVSFYMLPNEARFYDKTGRLEEICYQALNPDPGLPATNDLRWLALGNRVGRDQKHAGISLLTHHMSEIAIVRLQGLTDKLAADQDAWRALSADPAKKEQADKALAALQEKLRKGMEETFDSSGRTLAQAYEEGVRSVAAVPDLYLAGQDVIPNLVKNSGKPDAQNAFAFARKRLVDFNLIMEDRPGHFVPTVNMAALTAGEKYHFSQFHLTVLSLALIPELLDRDESPAYVDPRLTTPKNWRDVYEYAKDGKPKGWTRIMGGKTYEFDTAGNLLPRGPGGPVTPVKYVIKEKNLEFVPK